MTARAAALTAVALATLAVTGCGSGSSGGPAPVATSAGIDSPAVDSALSHVLTGLRAIATPSNGASQNGIVATAHHAATELEAAADALVPVPAGVPKPVAAAVTTRLRTVANLMTQTATCLGRLGASTQAAVQSCSQPLRDADQLTPKLAHDLISLAAYSSTSPSRFESRLVAALRGQ